MAVELLVRMFDGPGGRKKGDILSPKDVPHGGFGKGEGPPDYAVVRIEDRTAKDIQTYTRRHVPILFDAKNDVLESYRNVFRLNIDALPAVDRTAILTIGRAYLNWSAASARLIDVIALDRLGIR